MYEKVKTLLVMALAVICVAVIFSPALAAAQTTRPAPVTSPEVKEPGTTPLPDLIVANFNINKSSFRKVDSKTYGVRFTATLRNIGKGIVKKRFYFTIQRYDHGAGTWKNTALGKTKNCYKITAPIAPKGSKTVSKELRLTHAELSLPERSRRELRLRVLVDTACKGETPSSQFLGPQSHIPEAIESNNDSPFVVLDPPDLGFEPGQIQTTPLVLKCQGRAVTIQGTAGDDTISGTPGDDIIHGLGGNDTINGLGGTDYICGGDGEDELNGGPGDDWLWGDDDNDMLYGNDGIDFMNGGDGDDRLYGGDGDDWMIGHYGNDMLYGNDGNDRLYDFLGTAKLWGGDGDDYMHGSPNIDTMYGGGGSDTMEGHGGNDEMYGNDGDDYMYGGDDDDRLYGGRDDDRLKGESGNDELHGGAGQDSLIGREGDDDLLSGGHGNDHCDGGPGTDTYGFGGGANGGCEQTVSIP